MSATDTLARTIWGEARGDGIAGMSAVACVVLNRVNSGITWWGDDIESVCRKPYQFSCWNSNDPNLPKLQAVTEDDPQFAQALEIATGAVDGDLFDTTNDATSYKVTSLPWPVAWGPEVPPVAVIGSQSFYVLN